MRWIPFAIVLFCLLCKSLPLPLACGSSVGFFSPSSSTSSTYGVCLVPAIAWEERSKHGRREERRDEGASSDQPLCNGLWKGLPWQNKGRSAPGRVCACLSMRIFAFIALSLGRPAMDNFFFSFLLLLLVGMGYRILLQRPPQPFSGSGCLSRAWAPSDRLVYNELFFLFLAGADIPYVNCRVDPPASADTGERDERERER